MTAAPFGACLPGLPRWVATLINTQQETLDGVKVVRAPLRFRFVPPLGDMMAQVSELPGVVGVDLSPCAADDL